MKDLIEFNLETAVDAWHELRIGKGVDAISDCDEFFPSTLGLGAGYDVRPGPEVCRAQRICAVEHVLIGG